MPVVERGEKRTDSGTSGGTLTAAVSACIFGKLLLSGGVNYKVFSQTQRKHYRNSRRRKTKGCLKGGVSKIWIDGVQVPAAAGDVRSAHGAAPPRQSPLKRTSH